jgi:hypothetical protein
MSTAPPPKQKAPALAYPRRRCWRRRIFAMTDTVCISRMAVVRASVRGIQSKVAPDAVRQLVSGNGTLEERSDVLARRLALLGRHIHIHIYAESDKLAEIEDR